MIDLKPLGDRAFLARFDQESEAQGWAEEVRRKAIDGVVDVAVAYATAAVFLDLDRIDPPKIERTLQAIGRHDNQEVCGRLFRVPVLYDGDDLAEVAVLTNLNEDQVIEQHCSVDYSVFALGFFPGFPYAGYLPLPLIGVSRRKSPRLVVPAGSVAIAGRQTGVYPCNSPGGWHLLGRTPLKIVDLPNGVFPIQAGDRLRFESIGPVEFFARLGEMIGLAE